MDGCVYSYPQSGYICIRRTQYPGQPARAPDPRVLEPALMRRSAGVVRFRDVRPGWVFCVAGPAPRTCLGGSRSGAAFEVLRWRPAGSSRV
jgi:hypothetical protein